MKFAGNGGSFDVGESCGCGLIAVVGDVPQRRFLGEPLRGRGKVVFMRRLSVLFSQRE